VKPYLGLLVGSLFLIAPGTALAQPGTIRRPVLSPYLNLLQAGQSAGVNYYGLVRPEIDFREGIQKLQQQNQANQLVLTDLQSGTGISPTGHFAAFMTHGNYFQSFTGGPAGGSLTGAAAGASFGTLGGAGAAARPGAAPRPGR
jgi:hypothetical protein